MVWTAVVLPQQTAESSPLMAGQGQPGQGRLCVTGHSYPEILQWYNVRLLKDADVSKSMKTHVTGS